MKKKALAVLVTLALAVGLCPGAALASGGSPGGVGSSQPAITIDTQAVKNLPKGKTFKYQGSTYKVTKACKSTGEGGTVELVKYGGKLKKISYIAEVWNPERGGYEFVYDVTSIGPNAFNTKQGKKVTYLEIGVDVKKIGKNAFKNMTSLKELNLSPVFASCKYKSSVYKKIGSGAFKNAGKNKGKALTVLCGSGNADKAGDAKHQKYLAQAKKQLKKKGLSSKSTVDMVWM